MISYTLIRSTGDITEAANERLNIRALIMKQSCVCPLVVDSIITTLIIGRSEDEGRWSFISIAVVVVHDATDPVSATAHQTVCGRKKLPSPALLTLRLATRWHFCTLCK